MEYTSEEYISDESDAEELLESSEYDSDIYTDTGDIEYLSPSSEENEWYFTTSTKKRKPSESEGDNKDIKRPKKEDSEKSLIKVSKNNEINDKESAKMINIPCKNLTKGPDA